MAKDLHFIGNKLPHHITFHFHSDGFTEMLQINTGKFFKRGTGRINNLRGVLYTNGWFGVEDLETSAGSLRATGGERGNLAIVYELKERIEAEPVGPGVLVSHTVTPYLRDFAVIASFSLEMIFSTEIDTVHRLTNDAIGFASNSAPKTFVRRFFDRQVVATPAQRSAFSEFVDDLLGLERKKFLAAMRAIKTYVAALHSIPEDLGLSYTLLVSAAETLVQDFDGFQPSWGDVEDQKRHVIDAALKNASNDTADAVRAAILEVEHIAMRRRYGDFILSKIDASYFRNPTISEYNTVARHQLKQALKQAYVLRSQYIHSAQPLPDALAFPHGHWEVTDIDRRPALTIEGLARITRHVIQRFVAEGKRVETEEYDYGLERAGVVTFPLAVEYWLGCPLVDARHAGRRLEGFLSQAANVERGGSNAKITDLGGVLGDIERLFPQAPAIHQPALYILYVAFNAFIPEANRRVGWQIFMKKYASIGEAPSGEVLIGRTLLGMLDSWPLATHQEAYDRYWRERETRAALHAPRLYEAAAALGLAERYRKEGQEKHFRELVSQAIECHPGNKQLQTLESQLDASKPLIWREVLLNRGGEEKG